MSPVRAADEDDARSARDRSGGEEVQVGPSEQVGHRDPSRSDHLGHQHSVEIRTVGEDKQEGVLAVQGAQPGHRVFVDVHVVGAAHPVQEFAEGSAGALGVSGRHFPEIGCCLGPSGARVLSDALGDLCDLVDEQGVIQHLRDLARICGKRIGLPRQDPDRLKQLLWTCAIERAVNRRARMGIRVHHRSLGGLVPHVKQQPHAATGSPRAKSQ